MVQVDLVGPRHLVGGERFHALNQIEVTSHHAGIEIVEDPGDERVVCGLHALWRRHGLPGACSSTTAGAFTSPTGVGEVVRFCVKKRWYGFVLIAPVRPSRLGYEGSWSSRTMCSGVGSPRLV